MRLWLKAAPGSEELETEGAISIKGVATVEILQCTKSAVRVRHHVPSDEVGPREFWALPGDTIKSNIDLKIL